MTFAELSAVKITPPDAAVYKTAKAKWDALAKPLDGMGDFEELLCKIAAIQGAVIPDLSKKALLIMCADNGIVNEGVSQSTQEVTYDVATLMGQGKSSVGRLTADVPLTIRVFDVGINAKDTPKGVIDKKIRLGTADFLTAPAMSEADCLAAIAVGMEAVKECSEEGISILATGEMGIGNTTTATALLCALTGASVQDCTGRGAGLADAGLKRKIDVISRGLAKYPNMQPFDALCNLGGLDIAALAGVFIGAAKCHIPVVIDGLISAAAALVAERMKPGCRDFYIASHRGRERGMDVALAELSLHPVIHAGLALGEGTGAVMLFPLLDMALSLYTKGTVFGSTPIAQYERFEQ